MVRVLRLVAMPANGSCYIYRDRTGQLRQVGASGEEPIDAHVLLAAVQRYDWLLIEEGFRTRAALDRRRREIAAGQ
jgi:hypothetical protein